MGFAQKFRKGMISVAFGMATGAAMTVGSVFLLDDFDDHMRARDMDPAVAQGLSDQKVYVRNGEKNNFIYNVLRLNNPFAEKDELPHMEISTMDALLGRCRVNVHEVDLRGMAAGIMNIPTDKIREIPPELNKAFNDYVLLHEARHCHSDTRDLGKNSAEGDADYHALLALEETEGIEELATAVRHIRALSLMWTRTHDTSLILDAHRHDRMPPTEEAINYVRVEIGRKIFSRGVGACRAAEVSLPDAMMKVRDHAINESMNDPTFLPRVMTRIYKDEELEPMVRRRIGLYLAAVQYFSPEMASDMRSGQREKWSCESPQPAPGPTLG